MYERRRSNEVLQFLLRSRICWTLAQSVSWTLVSSSSFAIISNLIDELFIGLEKEMLSSDVHPARRFFLLERMDYEFGHLKTTLTPLRSRACRGKKRSCWISTSALVVSNNSCLSNRRNTVATANRSSAFARLEHVSISGSLINLLHILHPYTLPRSFCKRDEISIKGW
jgi:hypothetical protein